MLLNLPVPQFLHLKTEDEDYNRIYFVELLEGLKDEAVFAKLSEQHLALYTYSVGKINNVSKIKMWPHRWEEAVLSFSDEVW